MTVSGTYGRARRPRARTSTRRLLLLLNGLQLLFQEFIP
jgi:hypothetical protein